MFIRTGFSPTITHTHEILKRLGAGNKTDPLLTPLPDLAGSVCFFIQWLYQQL